VGLKLGKEEGCFWNLKGGRSWKNFLIRGMCSLFGKENEIGSRRGFTMVTPEDGRMKRETYLRIKGKR
uniref:hypothetical protein n=1 Tax=Bacillus velezensis TaxID=492670 RepID=UPI001C92E80D